MAAESLEKLNQLDMWLSSARNSLTLAGELCEQIDRSPTHLAALKEFAKESIETLKICEQEVTTLDFKLAAIKLALPKDMLWPSPSDGSSPGQTISE